MREKKIAQQGNPADFLQPPLISSFGGPKVMNKRMRSNQELGLNNQ